MPFTMSLPVKKVAHSKALWFPKEWGIKKGDVIHLSTEIGGKQYICTPTAKFNCSTYVIIPHWWPCEVKDIIDVKISYATVPVRQVPPKAESRIISDDVIASSEDDGDSRAED